jgi:hypothetical protein
MGTTNDVHPLFDDHMDQTGAPTMRVKAFGRISTIAGILFAILLIIAASPAEATPRNIQSFTLAERQLLLIERMTNSALLTALEIDAAPRLNSIHWSRNRFDRMQANLLKGNAHLGLRPTTEPKILKTLEKTELEWRRYDTIFRKIVASGNPSRTQIIALTASHANTIDALRETVTSYQYFVNGGRHHSILSSTINGTGRLRASAQLLLRELMMAAYNEYAVQDRRKLAQSTQEFDQTINGLIHGDPALGLLAAATRDIERELLKVHRMWKEVRPILDSAASGTAVNGDKIAVVARYANKMAVPLTMALIMYLNV